MSRHAVRRAGEARPVADADGLRTWSVVDEGTPAAVHTGFAVCELDPGGSTRPRAQSFEESVFVLDGSPVLRTPEGAVALGPGDYALVPVGYPHAWQGVGETVARWARMRTPQPRDRLGGDAFAVPLGDTGPPQVIDVRDPRNRLFGHIEPSNLDPGKQSQELLALSASMRTALLVYSGISVKPMVDSDLGAQLHTMFMVQYEPDGVAGAHDHPFEETYLFLDGEGEATFDGDTYRLGPGDAAFAGVGCVHGFRNVGGGPLRWLETQAPQPPGRHSYRFARDWDYLRAAVEGNA
jgi:quercetin dioxygenase-like cupin family protein